MQTSDKGPLIKKIKLTRSFPRRYRLTECLVCSAGFTKATAFTTLKAYVNISYLQISYQCLFSHVVCVQPQPQTQTEECICFWFDMYTFMRFIF